MPRPRVLIGEFKHETNSFCSNRTGLAEFKARYLKVGDEILSFFRGVKVELGGILAGCDEKGIDVIPSVAANAMPGGVVTREAMDYVKRKIEETIDKFGQVDGILLSLHGAMVLEDATDGEGELLTALREIVGSKVPIMATLDLHANITPTMIEKANCLFAYDTYPHVDQYDRGYEAAKVMARFLRGEIKPVMKWKRIPILAPFMPTEKSPMKDIMDVAHHWEQDRRVISVSVVHGFPWADIPECGCSVIAITNDDEALAEDIVNSLSDLIWQKREKFTLELTPIEEAVKRAIKAPKGPVILADIADNPGGGGSGDTIYILKELIKQGAKNVGWAIIWDPEVVKKAVEAGVRSKITVRLGGKVEPAFPDFIEVEATVRTITDGIFFNKGPMGRGLKNDVGIMVSIDVDGIEILIPERRIQPWDPEIFRRAGIDPTEKQILVVKSSVHFRAAYGQFATEIIEVDAPGITAVNFQWFNFRNVRRPIYPLDVL